MDIQTDKQIEEAEDVYGEEVLNASWLPEPESWIAGSEPAHDAGCSPLSSEDVEAFLSAIYRFQE